MKCTVKQWKKKKLMWMLQAEEEILDIGCRTEISKKTIVLRTKMLQTLIVQQQHCENFVEVGCQGIVQWDRLSRWSCLFWYNTVWRNSRWHAFLPSESWYSEPLKQLIYCAVGFRLKSVDLAFILWPKKEEWVMQRKGITRFEKCNSSEMVI